MLLGGVGVVAFSGTLVATRAADTDFGALTVGTGRAVIAAVMAAVVLVGRGQPLVPRADRRAIASVAGTVVIGFPVLTAIALTHVPAIHAAIVVGLAPAATAGFAVLLSNERPTARYWIALSVGLVAVLAFAAAQGAGLPQSADLIVLLAAVLVGFGYAHGGALAKRYGGGTVICWALIIAVPLTVPLTVVGLLTHPVRHIGLGSLIGLAYVSLISMFIAFFAWYRGLALGGIASVGRLQLGQPLLTLLWASLLLGEHISLAAVITAPVVLFSVVIGRSAATRRG